MPENGYDQSTAEGTIERGQRVERAEHDENELHPLGRQAVVAVRGNMAITRGSWR
jgi:hypothetical protein